LFFSLKALHRARRDVVHAMQEGQLPTAMYWQEQARQSIQHALDNMRELDEACLPDSMNEAHQLARRIASMRMGLQEIASLPSMPTQARLALQGVMDQDDLLSRIATEEFSAMVE
jgi:hypothetical protein